jgi:hypothetical protein
MLTDSPWARPFTLSTGGLAPPGGGGRNGGRGGGGRGGGAGADQTSPASMEVIARWQSALPLKQALMRLRFGAEASTSPQAKEFLDHAETAYVIVLSGPLRGSMRGNPEDLKASLMDATSLTAKGKEALKPTDVQTSSSQKTGELVLFFPRTAPFTLDDKDVELSTKLGALALKFRFHLRDMVFNANLEL